jgi:hypothetical protein
VRAGVWNLETGQLLMQVKLPWNDVAGLALSPDGETLTCVRSWYDQNKVPAVYVVEAIAWNVTTGKEKFKFTMPAAPLTGVAYSPDGRALVIGVQNALLWVGDTETGGARKLISVDNDFGISGPLIFAADGRTFAVVRQRNLPNGGLQSKIQIWETASRSVRQELPGHMAMINALTFTPDAKTIGSASSDTTALLWDLTGSQSDTPLPAKLEAKELAELWEALNNPLANPAFHAQVRLGAAPGDAVTLLRERLQAAGGGEPPTKEQIAKWIKDLDDDDFDVREKASVALAEAGKAVEKDLTKALENTKSTEVTQRIQRLLEKLAEREESKAILRPLRALEVLERIGTPEAREIVKKLAGGKADAPLTVAAKATLERWR